MKTVLEKWLAAARRDEPVWLADVRKACAAMSDAVLVTARLLGLDGATRDFPIPMPGWETGEQRRFAEEYLHACVFNILSVHSGRRMAFLPDRRDGDILGLLHALPEAFQVNSARREGYGKVINIADRLCRAFGYEPFSFDITGDIPASPAPAAGAVSGLEARLSKAAARAEKGLLCGLDIGGTDVKLVLAENGRLLDVDVLDWDPASCPAAEGIIGPVLDMVRMSLSRHASGRKLDGLGVSFPDVVIRDRIVGGETPKTRGMRASAPDYEAELAKLTGLGERLAELCRPGAPIRIVNDGHMAAFTAAAELVCYGRGGELSGGVVAHTLGTDLGTGWLGPDGTVPEVPMEFYDLLLDLGSYPSRELPPGDLRSVRNENSGLPDIRRSVGQSAAFRLAWKQDPTLLEGFLSRTGDVLFVGEKPDMRKPCLAHLMDAAGQGDENAQHVFRQIGRNLGQVFREEEWLLRAGTDTRYLFGRFIMEPACFACIREGCRETAPRIRLEAADGSMAFTPLMRALADRPGVTVAQFGQAVGAVYYSQI